MRPSALARSNLTVFMYVLADHRVQKPMSFGYESVQFADWVDPSGLEQDSALAPFVPKELFLTKIVEQINQPDSIQDDYIFEYAAQDDIYHAVRYNYIVDIAGFPVCLLIPCGLGLFLVGAVLLIRARRRQAQRAQAKP